MKLKRKFVNAKYVKEIEAMYGGKETAKVA
jgi:hypothetical protein